MIYATITGRVAFDAELKDINGKKYIRVSVPQQDRRDGPTTWVDVMASAGQNPEGAMAVLRKGAIVTAQGDLKVRPFASRDGGAKVDVTLWTGRINVEQYARDEQKAAATEEPKDDEQDLPF